MFDDLISDLAPCACCFGGIVSAAAFVLLLLWVRIVRPAGILRQMGEALGRSLGWSCVVEHRELGVKTRWYQGALEDGRRAAFTPYLTHRAYHGFGEHRSGTRSVKFMRLAVEVLIARPLNVVCYSRTFVRPEQPDPFLQAFEGTNLENIPPKTRVAMLQFKHKYDVKLRLRDRATARTAMFPPGVLDGASVVVAQEFELADETTVEMVQKKLAELLAIAHILEAEAE